jgi:hypothetical protein
VSGMDVFQKLDIVEIVARDEIDDERLEFCESDSLCERLEAPVAELPLIRPST